MQLANTETTSNLDVPGVGKLSLSVKKIRIYEKKNTMKIKIDLSKEEAEAFKTVCSVICPPGVSIDQFSKSMFLVGINNYIDRLKAEKAKQDAAGVPENVEVITENE
jgi:hypothetical protein